MCFNLFRMMIYLYTVTEKSNPFDLIMVFQNVRQTSDIYITVGLFVICCYIFSTYNDRGHFNKCVLINAFESNALCEEFFLNGSLEAKK